VRYWTMNVPASFNPKDPTLVSLSYYPLRVVAAEWVKYVAVMHNSIKQYEYSHENVSNFPNELDKLNSDLRDLQSWRRRSMLSLQKIHAIIRLLKWRKGSEPNQEFIEALLEDFRYVATNMEDAGRRLESMLPVVTSLVQIVDARRSFAETANVSRLTILALVFVPLSFISTLFSMDASIAPGGPYFWVYLAVAVPVTLLVLLVARPPTRVIRNLFSKIKGSRKGDKPFGMNRSTSSLQGKESQV